MAAKIAEYLKRKEGDATVFDVTPAKAPKYGAAIGMGVVAVVLGLGMFASGGFFLVALGAFSVWYGWARDVRPKGYKEKSTFRVTPTSIQTNGRTFEKDDIHRLLIKNGITEQEVDAGVEMSVSAAQAAGMVHRARIAKIANALTIETGGKATIVAGGMDDTTAFGLLTDVARIIGFK